MRAALLPAGSDPFLNAWWLRHYGLWSDEVDELRMIVYNQPDPEVQAYLRDIADNLPHVVIGFHPRMEHGDAIGELIEATPADLVMLCEDDAFVRKAGRVDEAFAWIESGKFDMVACPRASGTPNVMMEAMRQHGLYVTETGEEGPAYWPAFFFGRREDLRATDRHYGAWYFSKGDKVPGLDYICEQGEAADTFSGTSFQLRAAGLTAKMYPQYRTDAAFRGGPWFHVGSLSSGHGTYFMGGMDERSRKRHGEAIDDNARIDWSKRMSWWERVADEWDGGIPEYHARYVEELGWLFNDLGLSREDVDYWRGRYDGLVP